jgi:hypothetical protein
METDKVFAPWAPEEKTIEANKFINKILKHAQYKHKESVIKI